MERLGEITTRVGVSQLPAGVGGVVCSQVARIGQQHRDFAIAEDMAGSDRYSGGGASLKRALVQLANSLNRVTCAGCA